MLDLRYAHGQIPLSPEASQQCNFSIVGGQATGKYRFKSGFYGLMDMPAEFQQTLDMILNDMPNVHAFIDDILIVSCGSKEDHIQLVDQALNRLDQANMSLKLSKCTFLQKEVDWLGYHITSAGTSPMQHKISTIVDMEYPKTHKELKSFMGVINQFNKFIPNLALHSSPLRPLLNRNNDFHWEDSHKLAFDEIKQHIQTVARTTHFDINKPIRITCDASHDGLGATLEQMEEAIQQWRPIAFASRFLNTAEPKYSTNELELLAIVWATEHFRYYIYGRPFTVITDHQALLTALKPSRGNKT